MAGDSTILRMFLLCIWQQGLFLSVYGSDIKVAGKKQNVESSWKRLLKHIDPVDAVWRIFPARTPFNRKFVADAVGAYVVTRTRSAFFGGGPIVARGVGAKPARKHTLPDQQQRNCGRTWKDMPGLSSPPAPSQVREVEFQESKLKTLARVSAADYAGPISKRDRGVAHEEDEYSNQLGHDVAWNDVTGSLLEPREVNRTRLEYIRSEGDVNKGGSINLNQRSRFVAMEFNTQKVDGVLRSLGGIEDVALVSGSRSRAKSWRRRIM